MIMWRYLTSAKLDGRSAIRAPPKSGVLRKVVMLIVQVMLEDSILSSSGLDLKTQAFSLAYVVLILRNINIDLHGVEA